jgi:hypothetical protein
VLHFDVVQAHNKINLNVFRARRAQAFQSSHEDRPPRSMKVPPVNAAQQAVGRGSAESFREDCFDFLQEGVDRPKSIRDG